MTTDPQLPGGDGLIADLGELMSPYKGAVIARPEAGFQFEGKVIDLEEGAQPL